MRKFTILGKNLCKDLGAIFVSKLHNLFILRNRYVKYFLNYFSCIWKDNWK